MCRCRSLQAADKRAERITRDADKRRKEKRRSWLLMAGIAMVSVGLTVADYFWLQYQARQRHERHYQHQEDSTNTTNLSVLPSDTTVNQANHE